MITPAERDRMRELAKAAVERNAPPATGEQSALLASLLGPAATAAAERREAEAPAAKGAA